MKLFSRGASDNTFYCFSPPVMIITFAIEIALALYALWRYKMSPIVRVIVAILVSLAIFQGSEYFVCGGAGMSAENWSRLGYASITMLPPLGLHLLYLLAGRKTGWGVWMAYATGLGFIVYFLGYHDAFRGFACTGNYVIFQLGERASLMYSFYYYSWLVAAIALGMRWHGQSKDKRERRVIVALITGYLVFLAPTALVSTINPDTRQGIPSIMCGFAVLFALILSFYILPKAAKRRT